MKDFIASRRTELVCLLLAAATLAVYWQVTGFEFTNYDEFTMILQNPHVLSGLTLQGLWWGLTTSWFEYWHPVTWWSHMLDCELFGLNAGWHHLVSLGFHVANTLLLFGVVKRMTGAFWRSVMVAALFALHPLHVESVAWVAERKDVLSAFFFLLTLWAYARYAEGGRLQAEVWRLEEAGRIQESGADATHHVRPPQFRDGERAPRATAPASSLQPAAFYCLALLFFTLGLMSKPMVVTLPFVLLLLDYWPLRRLQLSTLDAQLSTLRPLLLEKLPFFALSAASCLVTYLGVKAGGSILSAEAVPWTLRLGNVPVSYVRYLWKMIWPADLVALYPMPDHWAWWQVTGAVLVLAVISVWVVRRARSAPYLIVGWLFFLGVLVPTIGLVQAGYQAIADRYTYVPFIGLFIALVWCAADQVARASSPAGLPGVPPGEGALRGSGTQPELAGEDARATCCHWPRATITWVMAGVILAACGWLTWLQAGVWRNGETLWRHCVAIYPDSFIARYNLGYVFQHSNRTSDAIEHYRAALRRKPDHVDANLNLGIALIASGRSQEATNCLGKAVRLKPGYAKAQNALGLALLELGDYAGAIAHCAEAARLDPEEFGPYINLGRALSAQGKSDDALRNFAEGLRLQPAIPQSHYYLGLEWMKRGAFEQAAASFSEALRLAPGWAEARDALQRAREKLGKPS
ncbi:MAG TPA: tetratricopeptide repeat protein [Candidatus Paceibacterota bacterium]|nr:tetratricopeptide repeat protein [Verrucomicrobiota bacterium]HSA11401.1 tetratricopeptide repeat protein [Candidatus Paceibacterota bacterium]